MSHKRQYYATDSSASSRVSVASIAHLPRRTETGELNRALPRVPLRVPQRNPRRSLPPDGTIPGASGPTPYVSPDGSPHHPSPATTPTWPLSPFHSAPPPAVETEKRRDGVQSTRSSVMHQKIMADAGPEDEMAWVDHRQRRCRFMILVGVLTAVIVGLAVGLAVGLGNGNSSAKSGRDSSSPNAVFPAGAYSFDMYLRENSTGCTSRAASWSCYPEEGASSTGFSPSSSSSSSSSSRATFYWTLQAASDGDAYFVSGADNPFAPPFANLPASLLDAGQATERLAFAFSVNKTVTPADALSPADRAANCTYTGLVFQATLWTRRRGGAALPQPPSHPARYAPWPGDFEVAQYKNSTIGDPVCVDARGEGIADVQAAGGSCLCRYTSASMS